jgi:hypothetical protein
MTEKLIALRIRVTHSPMLANRESGQGTLEYIGAILVAGIIIGLVIAGVRGANITGRITAIINDILNRS